MAQTLNDHNLPQSPGTPRWVKMFGIFTLIVILLLGIILLSGGEHGPGRHMPSASTTEVHAPPADHQGQHP